MSCGLAESRRKRAEELRHETRTLADVLSIFRKSVGLLDEVDVLLHPLKSELNFPIGNRDRIDLFGYRWELPIFILDAIVSEHDELSRRGRGGLAEEDVEHDAGNGYCCDEYDSDGRPKTHRIAANAKAKKKRVLTADRSQATVIKNMRLVTGTDGAMGGFFGA